MVALVEESVRAGAALPARASATAAAAIGVVFKKELSVREATRSRAMPGASGRTIGSIAPSSTQDILPGEQNNRRRWKLIVTRSATILDRRIVTLSDRFAALQAFVAVCDGRGFAVAARRLDVSPAAVTRLVAGLEVHLGVRLLHRTTRSVTLTEAGARLLDRARRILADVEDIEADARQDDAEPRGRIVVAAPEMFGRLYVVPLLSRFLDLYPATSADLRLANRMASLVEEGIDLAVRVGDLPDSTMVARSLGATSRVLAASPDYLARYGRPALPSDLGAHRLVAFEGTTPRRDWPFRYADQTFSIEVEPRWYSGSADTAVAHAVAGGGIVAALRYQVGEHLRAGRLVEVLQDYALPSVPIQAVFPTARHLSIKVRAFSDMLAAASSTWSAVR